MPDAAVPVLLLTGPPGAGKTRLMQHWARQVPDGERWTFITRGQAADADMPPASPGALTIALAHDCACCNGKLVLQTHLARTLRMRRPDRLLVEAVLDSHLPATLQWLGGSQWAGWFGHVRCMALLPLIKGPSKSSSEVFLAPSAVASVPPETDARGSARVPFQRVSHQPRRLQSGASAPPPVLVETDDALLTDLEQLALSHADVVCFDSSAATSGLDTVLAAERLLRARAIGGVNQWRINAGAAKIAWDAVEPALAMARRPL